MVVVHRDPDRCAAALAGAVGGAWASGGESGEGYLSATVPVGAGSYVDVLWPLDERSGTAGTAMRSMPDGALVAWAVEVVRPKDVADRLLSNYEAVRADDGGLLYEMVSWPEAVRSGGVIPFGVAYTKPMAGRYERSTALWPTAPGGGITGLRLTGDVQHRMIVDAFLDGSDRLDGDHDPARVGGASLDWSDGPPRLIDVGLGSGLWLGSALAALPS